MPIAAENYGKTSHDTETVEQSDTAHDQAGQADNSQEEVKLQILILYDSF